MRVPGISGFPIRLLALGVLCLIVGCRGAEPDEVQPFDTDYLVKPPQKEQVAFEVIFARYEEFDRAAMEEGWAALTVPEGQTAELWRKNGLRVGWAAGEKAGDLRRILKRMRSLRSVERGFEMPSQLSFKVVLARQASMGLVYETAKAKAYKDVTDLEFGLLIRSLGAGESAAVSIVPFLVGDEEVMPLEGMQLLLEIAGAEIIAIGPVSDPPERRLGELMLLRDDPTGLSTSLVLIEPELIR